MPTIFAMRSRILTAVIALITTAGLGGQATAAARTAPRLTGSHPCAGQPGFTCATLTVPLDHSGRAGGTLDLQVATADNANAPRGILLFLTGGPGQPGVPSITRIATQRMPELAKNYRFVTIDQRGTGQYGAIDCPRLQAQVGSSDIATPSTAAVGECAGIVGGKRPYYSTEQTIGDYDWLRQALGVRKMTVDGVSYGSFTAARYAAGYPSHVSRVVLDSVLPHVDPNSDDGLYLVGMRGEARVLRDACRTAPACGYDPASDLARVVRHRSAADQVTIFDTIVTYEFLDPTYRDPNPAGLPAGSGDLIGAVHAARHGDPARLNALLTMLKSGGDPVASFSSGLHAATFCADAKFPWGDASAPVATRRAKLHKAVQRLKTRQFWPYTRQTVENAGFTATCRQWPAERPGAEGPVRLPNVPVLLINGDHDLSTPLEWAREELRHAPDGRLVIVKGASHSIQNRELGTQGRNAVYAFLNG